MLSFTDRVFDESRCNEFMFMVGIRRSAAFQEMHMAAVFQPYGGTGSSVEFVFVSAAGVRGKTNFVDMASITGDGFTGNCGEPVIVGKVAAA